MKVRSIRRRSDTNGSTTSNQTRPVSRASTTSVNTTDEQPTQAFQSTSGTSHLISGPDLAHQHFLAEAIFAHPQQHFGNPSEHREIDPSLHYHNTQQNPIISSSLTSNSAQPGESNGLANHQSNQLSFQDKTNDSFVSINDGSQDEASDENLKKKKGSASSIANDQELRRLYQENKDRTLRDVADTVLQEERGPRSEKTKQIFAMIW